MQNAHITMYKYGNDSLIIDRIYNSRAIEGSSLKLIIL